MVNDLRIRRGIANLLNPHGMAGSEIVDAPCVSMSLKRILNGIHRLGEVRFLSRSPTNANKQLIMNKVNMYKFLCCWFPVSLVLSLFVLAFYLMSTNIPRFFSWHYPLF